MRFQLGFCAFAALLACIHASGIESHFYSSPSDCGASSPSNWHYSFVQGACYLNQTVLGITSCDDDFGCLEQHLDFADYQTCIAAAANGTLAAFGGSFEMNLVDGQVIRTQYSTDNCLGTSDELIVLDQCNLNTCSGQLRRQQWFPQPTTETSSFPIPAGTGSASDDDDEDDTDSATTGEIVGVSVGFGVLGLILFCGMCCYISFLFFICVALCVIIIVLLVAAMVYYRKNHQKSHRNLGDQEDRYHTEAAPSDIELDTDDDDDDDSDVDPIDDF